MTRRSRPLPPDIAALERQVELINGFPDQNPNPVLRIRDDGLLLYANEASSPILTTWAVAVGETLAPAIFTELRTAAEEGNDVAVQCEIRSFAVLPVAVPEFGFMNLYGTDVTAAKVVARFPDRNPNPVLRTSQDGLLVYANDASRQITWKFGCRIGEPLPDEIRAKITAALDGSGPPSFEIQSEGRTYVLLPVLIPEFGFINLYGTDITAQKAVNRFPDQNPNPVLRVNPCGHPLVRQPRE